MMGGKLSIDERPADGASTYGACLMLASGVGTGIGVASGSIALGVGMGAGLLIFMAIAFCKDRQRR